MWWTVVCVCVCVCVYHIDDNDDLRGLNVFACLFVLLDFQCNLSLTVRGDTCNNDDHSGRTFFFFWVGETKFLRFVQNVQTDRIYTHYNHQLWPLGMQTFVWLVYLILCVPILSEPVLSMSLSIGSSTYTHTHNFVFMMEAIRLLFTICFTCIYTWKEKLRERGGRDDMRRKTINPCSQLFESTNAVLVTIRVVQVFICALALSLSYVNIMEWTFV